MSATEIHPAHYCPDCRWLKLQVDFDSGSHFRCLKNRLDCGDEVLWRTPCSDFEVEDSIESPAIPDTPARPAHRSPALLQSPDVDEFRRFMRDQKDIRLREKITDEHEAVSRFIHPGDYVGFELYGTVRCPLSIVREIVRQKIGDLRLAGQGLMDVDFLLAADLVHAMDLTYVGYEAHGLSPVLRRAVEKKKVEVVEWSNAALSWRFKAAAMGVPFLPIRSMLGSDTLKYSAAKTMDDPFTGHPLVLVPALFLDCAVIHVHRADRYGNCQIDGISGFAPEMSKAAKRVIISAEEIVEPDVFKSQPNRTTIPYYLVDAVVHAPYGAHPGETSGLYNRDEDAILEWLKAARSEEGTQAYIKRYIHDVTDNAGYLDRIGFKRLKNLSL